MNERIKQITGQVLDELVPETWVALGYDKIKEIQNRTAELIVQRTLAIVEAHTEIFQSDEARAMVEHIKRSVKTDFGVEE
jgi:hypothetical protein